MCLHILGLATGGALGHAWSLAANTLLGKLRTRAGLPPAEEAGTTTSEDQCVPRLSIIDGTQKNSRNLRDERAG